MSFFFHMWKVCDMQEQTKRRSLIGINQIHVSFSRRMCVYVKERCNVTQIKPGNAWFVNYLYKCDSKFEYYLNLSVKYAC